MRPTARLIVLDALGRVLLFKVEDENVTDPSHPLGDRQPRIFWCTPGGGVESGETFEEAALRELWEETGLTLEAVGPSLFERDLGLRVNERDVMLRERYFLVRAATAEISMRGFTPLEQSVYRDHRWWTLDALEMTDEVIYPPELPAIVRQALAIA